MKYSHALSVSGFCGCRKTNIQVLLILVLGQNGGDKMVADKMVGGQNGSGQKGRGDLGDDL